jgi:RNA polymerase sigma-70 factor (ECF subfamily)
VDPRAQFTHLYSEYHDTVLRYAVRRTDPDTARDVVAETFLVVWRRLSAVPPEARDVRPWLYGVARRVLANTERSRRRAELLTAQLRDRAWTAESQQDVADSITDRVRLDEALKQLSEKDREVLRLVGWEELDMSEAAVVMGCSRATMAVRLHRARKRLALALSVTEQQPYRQVMAREAEINTPS